MDLRSIAVQKDFVVSDDQNVAGPTPGDTLTYTLDVQISDFFTMGDIVLTDVLGDGLIFSGNAMLTVNEADGDTIATTAFAPSAIATTNNTPGAGQTTIAFDLSAAMIAAGAADGVLVGDLVNGGAATSPTTATITFDVFMADQFANVPGDLSVSQGDTLSNDVTVRATVRDNADPLNTAGAPLATEEDTSSAAFTLPVGGVSSKSIISINGVSPGALPTIVSGDAVTFSVLYTAPVGAFENLVLDDYMPLPVFNATTVTTWDISATPGDIPPIGTANFGAATTASFVSNFVGTPSVTSNGPSNSVSFDFGTNSSNPRQVVTIEILITVAVEDAVFADALLLTNQASITESNSGTQPVTTTAISNFVFGQPELAVTKGVIASTQGTQTGSTGPFAFDPPGSTGQRWPGWLSHQLYQFGCDAG